MKLFNFFIIILSFSLFSCEKEHKELSYNELSEIKAEENTEKAFNKASKIQKLRWIHFNKDENFHDRIPEIQEIQMLELVMRGGRFPIEIAKLPQLKYLILHVNHTNKIPEIIFNEQLKGIEIYAEFMPEFPKGILKCKNLERLLLNGTAEIPFYIPAKNDDELKEFIRQEIINIRNDSIDINRGFFTFPQNFSDLNSLEYLFIGSQYIQEIQPEHYPKTSLKNLTIQNTFITEIPENIQSLSNLNELNLDNNFIIKGGDFLYELPHLKEFSVRSK